MIAVGRDGEHIVLFVTMRGRDGKLRPTQVAVSAEEAEALYGQLGHLLGHARPVAPPQSQQAAIWTVPPGFMPSTTLITERTNFQGAAAEAAARDAAELRARVAAAQEERERAVTAGNAPIGDGDTAIVEARKRAAEDARELRRARLGVGDE
jgi:hypothetical protein